MCRRVSGSRAKVSRRRCASTTRRATRGLDDRCRGLQAGIGGRVRSLSVPLQDAMSAQRRMSSALANEPVDAVVTLGSNEALPAIAAVTASGQRRRTKLATFDLSPEVLAAVRDRKILFAVDQQPYLQGYLPVILLAEQVRHQIFPGKGQLIPTGAAVRPRRTTPRTRSGSARTESASG